MPSAPVLTVRDLRFGPMLVTELRYDGENYGRSDPIPAGLVFALLRLAMRSAQELRGERGRCSQRALTALTALFPANEL